MDHVVDHSKNSGSVAYYQLIKCRAITFLAPFYQVQFGDIGLSHRRFRLHIWTEARRFNSFQPRKPSEPKRRRHSQRYSPIRVIIPSRTWKRRCKRTECCVAEMRFSRSSAAAASIESVIALRARFK